MGRHPNNKVWEYFDYVSDKIAKCRSCRAKISTPGSSRGNMVRHLFQLHGINTYTAGPKVGLVLNHIPSKRGREFDESLKEGEHTTFQRFKHEISIESNIQDLQYAEQTHATKSRDDCSQDQFDYHDNGSNTNYSQSHHSPNQVLSSTKIPIIKVRSDSNLRKTHDEKNKQNDYNDAYDSEQSDADNISTNDPLLELNVESLDHHLPRNTSNSMHLTNSFTSDNCLERLKVEALAEKLHAEARYFNELADLTRSKRVYVDLQCEKIRNQLKKS